MGAGYYKYLLAHQIDEYLAAGWRLLLVDDSKPWRRTALVYRSP